MSWKGKNSKDDLIKQHTDYQGSQRNTRRLQNLQRRREEILEREQQQLKDEMKKDIITNGVENYFNRKFIPMIDVLTPLFATQELYKIVKAEFNNKFRQMQLMNNNRPVDETDSRESDIIDYVEKATNLMETYTRFSQCVKELYNEKAHHPNGSLVVNDQQYQTHCEQTHTEVVLVVSENKLQFINGIHWGLTDLLRGYLNTINQLSQDTSSQSDWYSVAYIYWNTLKWAKEFIKRIPEAYGDMTSMTKNVTDLMSAINRHLLNWETRHEIPTKLILGDSKDPIKSVDEYQYNDTGFSQFKSQWSNTIQDMIQRITPPTNQPQHHQMSMKPQVTELTIPEIEISESPTLEQNPSFPSPTIGVVIDLNNLTTISNTGSPIREKARKLLSDFVDYKLTSTKYVAENQTNINKNKLNSLITDDLRHIDYGVSHFVANGDPNENHMNWKRKRKNPLFLWILNYATERNDEAVKDALKYDQEAAIHFILQTLSMYKQLFNIYKTVNKITKSSLLVDTSIYQKYKKNMKKLYDFFMGMIKELAELTHDSRWEHVANVINHVSTFTMRYNMNDVITHIQQLPTTIMYQRVFDTTEDSIVEKTTRTSKTANREEVSKKKEVPKQMVMDDSSGDEMEMMQHQMTNGNESESNEDESMILVTTQTVKRFEEEVEKFLKLMSEIDVDGSNNEKVDLWKIYAHSMEKYKHYRRIMQMTIRERETYLKDENERVMTNDQILEEMNNNERVFNETQEKINNLDKCGITAWNILDGMNQIEKKYCLTAVNTFRSLKEKWQTYTKRALFEVIRNYITKDNFIENESWIPTYYHLIEQARKRYGTIPDMIEDKDNWIKRTNNYIPRNPQALALKGLPKEQNTPETIENVDEVLRDEYVMRLNTFLEELQNGTHTRHPTNREIFTNVCRMLIRCHNCYRGQTVIGMLRYLNQEEDTLNLLEIFDNVVEVDFFERREVIQLIRDFFAIYDIGNAAVYMRITTPTGTIHDYPINFLLDKYLVDSQGKEFWNNYHDNQLNKFDQYVIPMDLWSGIELVIARSGYEGTNGPKPHSKVSGRNKGDFFPYTLNLKYKELLPLLQPFGITLQGDKIATNNCFLYALEQWNQYIDTHQGCGLYRIPNSVLTGIKQRLLGKGVKAVTLTKICDEYDLYIEVTINVVYTGFAMTEDDKKARRRANVARYGRECSKEHKIDLGLITIDHMGHYFCNIPTEMTVAGVKYYDKVWEQNNKKPLESRHTCRQMISIHSYGTNGSGVRYPTFTRTVDGIEVSPPYAKAAIIMNAMVDNLHQSDLLVRIPNAMMYHGAASSMGNKLITNPMIREQECRPISYETKECNEIIFVADTECSIQGRHIPYAIAFCPLGDENNMLHYIGEDCIDRFVRFLDKHVFVDKEGQRRKEKDQKHVVVYFHNLSYDGRMFTDHKIINLSMNGSRIIQMTLLTPKSNKIMLRDSYMLIPVKLAAFPRMFKTKEKEKQLFPYAFVTRQLVTERDWVHTIAAIAYVQKWSDEETQKFKEICMNNECLLNTSEGERVDVEKMIECYVRSDVKILNQGLVVFRKDIKEGLGLDLFAYLSISAVAYAYTKKEAYDKEDIYEYTGELRDYIRQAVYGGRCMTRCNISYSIRDDPIDDFDACSLYPSAMSVMKIPKGMPKKFMSHNIENHTTGELDNEDKEKILQDLYNGDIHAAIFRIRITDIGRPLAFPLIPQKDKNNVWQYKNEVPVELFVDDVMLKDLIQWQQITFDIIEGIYWNDGYSTKINDCIKTLYEKRKVARERGETIQEVYKLIMNSSYGKTIEKPHVTSTTVVQGEEQYKNKRYKDYSSISSIIEIDSLKIRCAIEEINEKLENEWLDETESESLIKQKDKLEKRKQYLFNMKEDYDKFWSPTMIGVRVLSTSKMLMNSVMVPAELENVVIFYQDTDSVHVYSSQLETLEYAWRKWNNKTIEDKLIGKDLCQFHSDFPTINVNGISEKTVSVYSIFIAKKIYMDYLVPESMYEQGKKYNEYEHSQMVIRMKGIPLRAMERKVLPSGNVGDELMIEIYEGLFKGHSYVFDIAAGSAKLQLTKDMVVKTIDKFERKCKPPKVARYEFLPEENDWNFIEDVDESGMSEEY